MDSSIYGEDTPWLIFLPGLTADHRLFRRQISYFRNQAHCLVWDPPAHGKSRPFSLTYSMNDLAQLLHDLLEHERISQPILVGQSMGGYISQAFISLFPGETQGFISIDSAPLEKSYYRSWEITALRHTTGMYKSIPWNLLLTMTAKGCSETLYGQNMMREMQGAYSKDEFCELAGYGFRILADTVASDTFGKPTCPTLLIWGENDKASFCKRYNRQWAIQSGFSFVEIPRAGHNANVDEPDEVNKHMELFIQGLRYRISAH